MVDHAQQHQPDGLPKSCPGGFAQDRVGVPQIGVNIVGNALGGAGEQGTIDLVVVLAAQPVVPDPGRLWFGQIETKWNLFAGRKP